MAGESNTRHLRLVEDEQLRSRGQDGRACHGHAVLLDLQPHRVGLAGVVTQPLARVPDG